MTKDSAQDDTADYPWDAVWEYILDDSNFDEQLKERNVLKKKLKEARVRRDREPDEPVEDYDSAYDEEEEQQRAKEAKARIEEINMRHAEMYKQEKISKPKRSKRFSWLGRRLRKDKSRKTQKRVTFGPNVEDISQTQDEAKFRRKQRENRNDEMAGQSDFGPAFFSIGNFEDDVSELENQSVQSESSSVFEHILSWGKPKEVSDEVSVSSKTSSVFDLLPWGKHPDGMHYVDNRPRVEGDIPDEVSVMESIFNFEETRSDFDVSDHHRHRAKQRWRSTARERTSGHPRELRRSFSDIFDSTRDAGSVQSSQSRRSRNSRSGFGDRRQLQEKRSVIVSDDISVASFLLETQGGYLVHVPSTIAISNPRRSRRRPSFQGY